jgi:hypothetical protein
MTGFYNVTAFYSSQPGRFARSKAGRIFKERLRQPGVFIDPPVTEWFWGAPGQLPDWPAAGARLFSVRMADIVQTHLSPLDRVQWLPAVVVALDGQRADYRIPHFVERPDVLDREASTWGPSGGPIRWVLSGEKVAGRSFFPSHPFGKNVIVDDTMLAAFQAAQLTGLDVDPARLSGR